LPLDIQEVLVFCNADLWPRVRLVEISVVQPEHRQKRDPLASIEWLESHISLRRGIRTHSNECTHLVLLPIEVETERLLVSPNWDVLSKGVLDRLIREVVYTIVYHPEILSRERGICIEVGLTANCLSDAVIHVFGHLSGNSVGLKPVREFAASNGRGQLYPKRALAIACGDSQLRLPRVGHLFVERNGHVHREILPEDPATCESIAVDSLVGTLKRARHTSKTAIRVQRVDREIGPRNEHLGRRLMNLRGWDLVSPVRLTLLSPNQNPATGHLLLPENSRLIPRTGPAAEAHAEPGTLAGALGGTTAEGSGRHCRFIEISLQRLYRSAPRIATIAEATTVIVMCSCSMCCVVGLGAFLVK